jgi:hypothetical protein
MPANEGEMVHFFIVHEPGTPSSSFLWVPVEPGHETLTNSQILEYEQGVQRHVHATASKTAVVKYFALTPKGAVRPMSEYDRHWDEDRIE